MRVELPGKAKGAGADLKVLVIAPEDVRWGAFCSALRGAGMQVATCGLDPREARRVAVDFAPSVVLVVLPDSGHEGESLSREVSLAVGRRPTVVLSPVPPHRNGGAVPLPGVAGYILTSASLDEVIRAVTVSAFSSLGVGGLEKVADFPRPGRPRFTFPSLTERQTAILGMVSRGMSYRGIGRELKVSPSLVRDEIMKMLKLVGARNQAELIARAARAGVLPREEPAGKDAADEPGEAGSSPGG